MSRRQPTLASDLLGGYLHFSTVRVLVVDDYVPWIQFVSTVLALQPQIKVVGEVRDGLTAIQKVAEIKPDVVVLDIGLPDMNGIQAARRILELAPAIHILFLTEHTDQEIVRDALLTGAQGYVVKSFAARELLPALDALLLGCYFVSAAAAAPKLDNVPIFKRLGDV
jgi:DNA-binding NarL/FixJ family response regulator